MKARRIRAQETKERGLLLSLIEFKLEFKPPKPRLTHLDKDKFKVMGSSRVSTHFTFLQHTHIHTIKGASNGIIT
jgi:hypothetical protein